MTPAKITDAIERSLNYEKRGEYEESLEALKPFWKDISNFPTCDGLSTLQTADVYLRCGSLGRFLAAREKEPNLIDLSTNLLTRAREIFADLNIIEKVAECENYISLNYWRVGALNEAKDWLKESCQHDLARNHPVRLYSLLIKAFLLNDTRKHEKVIAEYTKLVSLFTSCEDNLLKGCFYNELGIAYREIPNTKKAITCFLLAKKFYEKAKHNIHLGIIENNIAEAYSLERDVNKALRAVKRARSIFKKVGDKTKESFSIDTTAQILLEHGYYKRALIFANRAIELLENGQAYHNLVTSYQTKIKILAKLERNSEVLEIMAKAYTVAANQISEEFAKELISGTSEILAKSKEQKPETGQVYFEVDVEDKGGGENVKPIRLNFPEPQNFRSFSGVKLVNDRLVKFGLQQKYLAIVGETSKIEKGDLVAIKENDTDCVHCGIYDVHIGILGLDAPDHEPLLFDENSVRVLGKIIGYLDLDEIINNEAIVTMLD